MFIKYGGEVMSIKILYCASTTSHLKNFHLPYIKWLSEQGYEVFILANDGQIIPFTTKSLKVDFIKNVWSIRNIKSVFKINKFLMEEKFFLVITNTTLAGIMVRIAVMMMLKKERPKVLHICHGFLFNNSEMIKKWLFLLPELICSSVTDVFAVMNLENEYIAKQYRLGKKIIFTHGMGVSLEESCEPVLDGDVFKFVCIGDFSTRKNQIYLIKAFAKSKNKLNNVKLIFAGDGVTMSRCKRVANRYGIREKIDFLGHVRDIPDLLSKSNVVVSVSRYEGLPFNIMEAMLMGLPIIASDIAGHNDLLEHEYLYRNEVELRNSLVKQYMLGKRYIKYENIEKFTLRNVFNEWVKIYELLLESSV